MRDDPPSGTQPPVAGTGTVEPGSSQLPFAVNQEPSHDAICPFFQTIDVDGSPGAPIEAPDPANRCTALHEPVPQSLRQQELVCLTSGHVNCPRYLRGALVTGHAVKPDPTTDAVKPDKATHVVKPAKIGRAVRPKKVVPAGRTFTPALAGSLIVLTLAFLVSLGFVVSNGGLVLTAAAPTPSGTGGALAGVESAVPSASPTPPPTPSPSPTPTATPIPTPSPTPIATASPTTSPTAAPTPRPTSDRYALLKPCPDAPNCYLYVIRSGDNLYSIARYFGVPQATIEAWNPWTQNGLTVGRSLRLPPPTK